MIANIRSDVWKYKSKPLIRSITRFFTNGLIYHQDGYVVQK